MTASGEAAGARWRILLAAVQQAPAGRGHHQPAADLHRRQAEIEEFQDVRTHQQRGRGQDKAVVGHAPRQPGLRGMVDAGRIVEEDRRHAQGIDDGKQRQRHEQDSVDE